MAIGEADEAALAVKFAVMRPFLDERGWRVYLGTEANALGYGGIASVARAAGVSETTVAAGAAQAADPGALAVMPRGRSRRPGAGRPRAEGTQPGLTAALRDLLEAGRRGDPMSALTWSTLSLRDIAGQLAVLGFGCSKDTAARLMRADGWSLQGMAKVLEGKQHGDRDPQFGNINAQIARAIAERQPVISTDGKKKEQLGAYGRDGVTWQRSGEPVRALSHDFPDRNGVTICPYGIYDIAANRGFVSVGTSCDTAAFAVNAIRLWWQREGQSRYPDATRLLIICDAGGANGWRSHLWKDQLDRLREETGLRIEVMHFPPGTSKWNKIEHRLFCHITRTWRARPLMTVDDAVAGIAATVTSEGLKCTAVRDSGCYPKGIKVPASRVKYLQDHAIDRAAFHGEWNYAFLPRPRPAPDLEQEAGSAGPRPAMTAALAALAGIPDLPALLAAVTVPLQAAREQRLHLGRRGTRRKHSGPAGPLLISPGAIVAATAAHHVAGVSYPLLARLLNAGTSTISEVARQATPVLASHGITPRPGRAPIRTLAQLTKHAAAHAITIPSPPVTAGNRDTPETAN